MTRPATRGPLRVATFNVGLMSTFVRNWDRSKDYLGAGLEGLANLLLTDGDAEVLGRRIADRLLDAPYDVVVLNELFHADARRVLVDRITDPALPDGVRYPEVRAGFGAQERTPSSGHPAPVPWDVLPDLGPFRGLDDLGAAAVGELRALLDDSGLLVASRLPLRSFDLGGHTTDWAFTRYSASAGIDAFCPKGAAAVVVQPPGEEDVVITFTHLQADTEQDSHPGVRASQLAQLVWLADGVGHASRTQQLVVMGDLNVRGELSAQPAGEHGAEYDDVFGPTGVLGRLGDDGWRAGACAPGPQPVVGRYDPQTTHPEDQERLDYVLAGRLDGLRGPHPRLLNVQHLMLATNLDDGALAPESPIGLGPDDLPAPRGHVRLSDHLGLNAIIGHGDPHSSPGTAFDCTPPVDPTDPAPEAYARFEDVRHGELRWLVLEPGAYRIAPDRHMDPTRPVDMEVYDPGDLSRPLADVMPEDASPVDVRRGTRFPAVDHPLLVRLHGRTPTVDLLGATVRRVLGATPDDAVPLRPWTPTAMMPWPTPEQGGQPDGARWFEVLLDPPDPGSTQTLTFTVGDGAPVPATVEVFLGTSIETPASGLAAPAWSSTSPAVLSVPTSTAAQRRFLVRITPPPDRRAGEAAVLVTSDLRWLVSASFLAQDETGTDWTGSDEISWTIVSDLHPPGAATLHGYEDDVDTGEGYAMPTAGPLAFQQQVTVVLREGAGVGTDESATFVLPGGQGADVVSRLSAELPDDVKDGTYYVDFTWSSVLRHR